MRPKWRLARVREKRKEPPGRGSKQKELQSQPKYRSCHCCCQQHVAPSTSFKVNVNWSSVSADDNFEIVGQIDNCVQRREWGFSETGPSLDNAPESPEDLVKGTNKSSLSVPAQQHSTNASSSWCFGAPARKTQTSGQLLWGHIVPLTYLLPVPAFLGVDRIRSNGKDCVKINILPRDVKLSFSHLMGSGSRMPQSIGAQVTYSM